MTPPLTPVPLASSRVREVLLQLRPPQRIDMRSACRVLEVNERTLRRHLAAEGTSFAALVSEMLLDVARRCLLEERRTIQETAAALGFSDKASFHRAFKRWTGMTPRDYRREHMHAELPSAEAAPRQPLPEPVMPMATMLPMSPMTIEAAAT